MRKRSFGTFTQTADARRLSRVTVTAGWLREDFQWVESAATLIKLSELELVARRSPLH